MRASRAKTAQTRTPRRARGTTVWRSRFLDALRAAEGGGTVHGACEAAGIGRTTAYQARNADPEFAAAWDEAYDAGTEVLEAEAYRRGVTGYPGRPVTFRGEVVAEITEYSDTLMLALLKARRPEKYRERQEVRHSGSVTLSAQELAAVRKIAADGDVDRAFDALADALGGAVHGA